MPIIQTLQKLCDYVCDILLEESNVQPVSTPVTVCGDIHGQVGNVLIMSKYFSFLSKTLLSLHS